MPSDGSLPLGPGATDGQDNWTLDFFLSINTFTGGYKQHTAALKYFRERCEIAGNNEGFALSDSHKAAVAAIVHPPGTDYWFNYEDMRVWSWWDLVAQMDEESVRYVVEDGDCSRGLVGCEFMRRTGSYDHKRQVHRPGQGPQLREWDFVLKRSDGTAVRLHPEWSTNNIPTFAVEGEEIIQILSAGLGMSDGPGTFRYYKEVGQEKMLKFGRRLKGLV